MISGLPSAPMPSPASGWAAARADNRPAPAAAAATAGCASCGSDACKGCGGAEKSRRISRLSEEDQREVEALKARDREVRAHEQAHQAAGGVHAGAASYSYQRGPDGRSYAVGGEVPIDASEVRGDPEATIEKMQQVKKAALAPAEPSGQDRKVAALADAKIAQARAEMRRGEAGGEGEDGPAGETIQPSLSQQLAEMRTTSPGEDPSSASTGPADLTAYAANAYRHPALANTIRDAR